MSGKVEQKYSYTGDDDGDGDFIIWEDDKFVANVGGSSFVPCNPSQIAFDADQAHAELIVNALNFYTAYKSSQNSVAAPSVYGDAINLIGLLRSVIACGETLDKTDDAEIVRVLDLLRESRDNSVAAISQPAGNEACKCGVSGCYVNKGAAPQPAGQPERCQTCRSTERTRKNIPSDASRPEFWRRLEDGYECIDPFHDSAAPEPVLPKRMPNVIITDRDVREMQEEAEPATVPTVCEVPKSSDSPSCSACGAQMVPLGICDEMKESHYKNHFGKCANWQVAEYKCLCCGATTGTSARELAVQGATEGMYVDKAHKAACIAARKPSYADLQAQVARLREVEATLKEFRRRVGVWQNGKNSL